MCCHRSCYASFLSFFMYCAVATSRYFSFRFVSLIMHYSERSFWIVVFLRSAVRINTERCSWLFHEVTNRFYRDDMFPVIKILAFPNECVSWQKRNLISFIYEAQRNFFDWYMKRFLFSIEISALVVEIDDTTIFHWKHFMFEVACISIPSHWQSQNVFRNVISSNDDWDSCDPCSRMKDGTKNAMNVTHELQLDFLCLTDERFQTYKSLRHPSKLEIWFCFCFFDCVIIGSKTNVTRREEHPLTSHSSSMKSHPTILNICLSSMNFMLSNLSITWLDFSLKIM